MPDPGARRHYGTIQCKRVSGQNASGEDTVAWVTYVALWVSAEALQGREFQTVQQTWADARYKVEMPYIPGVQRAMRLQITLGGEVRYLEFLDVHDPDNTCQQLIAYCRELTE